MFGLRIDATVNLICIHQGKYTDVFPLFITATDFMSEQHEKRLLENINVIADKMTCAPRVLNQLVAEGIFYKDEMEELLSESPSAKQASSLVRLLIKKTDKGFFTFVDALRSTKQHALANRLYQGKQS